MAATLSKPRNQRQIIWAWLRANRQRFATVDEIAEACEVHYQTAYGYLRCLFRGGYVGVQKGSRFSRRQGYRLEKDGGIAAPRLAADGSPVKDNAPEAMWRTIKILRRFTLPELVGNVGMTHKITLNNAAYYTHALERAGYLKNIGTERKKLFVLINNTGAKAPQVMAVAEVYDPNLDEIVLRDVPDYD